MSNTPEMRPQATEVKFLIPPSVAPRIQTWARTCLQPDPHGAGPSGDEYAITTLYLDTPAFDVFARRGSFGRAKYRIRRYGRDECVYLERKLRKPGIMIKRRTVVPMPAPDRLQPPGTGRRWAGEWFARRVAARGLRPVCCVSYVRLARVGETPDGPVRLTLDSALAAGPATELRFTPGVTVPVLEPALVLELKYRAYMPALFRRLVEKFALTPMPVSKYRLSAAALRLGEAADLVALRSVRDTHA